MWPIAENKREYRLIAFLTVCVHVGDWGGGGGSDDILITG